MSAETVRKALGVDSGALPCLDKLDDAAAKQLARHLDEANRAHHQHIEQSMQEALNHFPRLLRGPIKKIFGM